MILERSWVFSKYKPKPISQSDSSPTEFWQGFKTLTIFPNPDSQEALIFIAGKNWNPTFPAVQTPNNTGHRADVGHILLKTGLWNGKESNLMKDLIVVGTTNLPDNNFLQDTGYPI